MKKDSLKEALFFLFPWVVAGFALRLWRALLQAVMFRDETTYAYQIRHILDGTIFSDATYYTFPPAYPALAAPIAFFTGDAEFAGRLISCIMGAATAIPAYYLAKDLFGLRAAVIAGAVTALFPPLLGVGVMAEPTYCFFITLGLYLAHRAFERGRARDYALFGIVLALAYLCRPEGFFVFFACLAILAAVLLHRKAGMKKILSLSAAALAGFFVLAFPYMLQLRSYFGAWELSGKTRINLAKVKAAETLIPGQDYDSHAAKIYDDLEKNKKDIAGNVLDELSAISRRYPANLKEEMKSFTVSMGYPLLAAGLFGAVLMIRSSSRLRFAALAGAFAPAFVIPAVFVMDRILVPYIPVVIVIAAYGISRLSEIMVAKAQSFSRVPVAAVPAVAAACSLALFTGQFGSILPETDRNKSFRKDQTYFYYYLLRQIGEESRGLIGPGEKVVTRNNIFPYYAGAEYVPMPPATDTASLLAYARKHGAGWFMYGPMEQGMQPQYMPVLMKNSVPQEDPLGDGSMVLVAFWDDFLLYRFNLERI